MEREWSIRPYEEGDLEKITDLYHDVQKHNKTDEDWTAWWKWQHQQNPAGPPIIYFADANGKLAGQYEMVRMKVRYDGKETVSFHSQDTMTHPDFRRQGIFKELADSTYQQGEEEGCAFVFGFPNKLSHPGFIKKLEFFDVCVVPNIFKPLNMRNTLKRKISNGLLVSLGAIGFKVFFSLYGNRKKAPKVKGLKVEQIKRFDERIDDLWKRASPHYGTMVVRNKDHVNWRYVDIPHRDYTSFIAVIDGRVAGYVVLSLVKKEGFTGGEIIDIFAEPDVDIIGNLLHTAIGYFRENGADSVYCWYPEMDVYRKAFRKFGFIKMGSNPQFINRKLIPTTSKEKLIDYSNWFVSMGDSDFH